MLEPEKQLNQILNQKTHNMSDCEWIFEKWDFEEEVFFEYQILNSIFFLNTQSLQKKIELKNLVKLKLLPKNYKFFTLRAFLKV